MILLTLQGVCYEFVKTLNTVRTYVEDVVNKDWIEMVTLKAK